MAVCFLDYETRSRCDLTARGAYNYSRDASTQILCMSYAFDDEDVQTWTPEQPFPQRVSDHFRNGGQIRAHNAGFDRLITEYVLCPDFNIPTPPLTSWYCTATQARANCAPGSLEDVGRFAGASMRKDHRGAHLVRQCCIPPYNTELIPELIEYCEQDVRAMRAISKGMRDLSPEELADYHVNERINDRGVLVDVDLCKAAVKYAQDELVEIENIVAEVTKDEITSVRSPKMREWVLERVGPRAKALMKREDKYSIDKTVRANLLAMEDPDEVPPDVAEVIQCADDLWASSVAKFSRLAQLADAQDGRVRGAFVFAGGSATGRYSSYGAQLHNTSRKCAKDPEAVRAAMLRGHVITPKYGARVTDVLKGMLRPAIMAAKGKQFVVADWSAVEARVTPWASMEPQAEEVLNVFRAGRDIYIREAAGIYRIPESQIGPESDERQIGKVAILSLGFAGGVGAFASMGRNYGIHMPESDARRIVDAWRRANSWAVAYWQKLEEAYTRAMRNKGHEFKAGRVTYLFDGQHLWYVLPSGRILCYPFARLEPEGVTYAKASWKPAADAKEWPRARLWKGLACENITQAIANDLLRNALRHVDEVVAHIHDEIVLETNDPQAVENLKRVMCTAPAWAQGLPLNAGVKTMERYSK